MYWSSCCVDDIASLSACACAVVALFCSTMSKRDCLPGRGRVGIVV